jgi:signal transduction histidine kinase
MIARDIKARKQHEAQLRVTEQALRQSQAHLRRLARHQQHQQEQERAAIAREIHDELAQSLTSLHMDIAWLAGRLPTNPEAHDRLQAMATQVEALDKAVHRIAMELHPRLLDDLGLIEALRSQVDKLNTSSIKTTLSVKGEYRKLPSETDVIVFRFIQEALSNVKRHSEASEVVVELDFESEMINIKVQDNGKGIALPKPVSKLTAMNKFGIIDMQERARMLDGTFEISSEQMVPRLFSLFKA